MPWENIEDRLQRPLTAKIMVPAGTIWLPDHYLGLDEWLMSIAETDEELRELNIRRIRFLQNRWRIEQLVQLEWEEPFDRISVFAMYLDHKADILVADGEYRLMAAIEQKYSRGLLQLVILNLLQTERYTHHRPAKVKTRHPDLLPTSVIENLNDQGALDRRSGPLRKPGHLSKLL